jgi:hypothetical protein
VVLECAGPEPITVSNTVFASGKHAVKRPEEAPIPPGAPTPAFVS